MINRPSKWCRICSFSKYNIYYILHLYRISCHGYLILLVSHEGFLPGSVTPTDTDPFSMDTPKVLQYLSPELAHDKSLEEV